jgi:putative ABC transport system ATP-binding protein
MESNLFKYIWRHSWREQLVILAVVLVSQVFYFLSLDLPKTIVNEPIQGKGFETAGATARYFVISFDLPEFLAPGAADRTVHIFNGFEFDRTDYLIALSLTFLTLVLINGFFKLQINTMKGRMGERMLRRLRYELFDRVLRFPIPYFRKVKQAEVATMIKDEVEPLGGFIGDAFVQPAFLGGQALTALAFILTQSIWLGIVTVAILVLQLAVIPPLRRPVLRLGKERQLTARQLAGRIAEAVDGAATIHVHDTSNHERADIVDRLSKIFFIRFRLYQLKFAVKFLNNLLAQMTPFLFYLVGGILAISGHLDVGGLVAVIAAYKDLPGPVKELLDWYQQLQDVQIKYEQVVEQFHPSGMLDPSKQALDADPGPPLTGNVVATSLVYIDDSDRKQLDGAAFDIGVNQHVAVIGDGGEALWAVLTGLAQPSSGKLTIGGRDMAELPEAVSGSHISAVGSEPFLFPVSVRDNILYGLRHRPLRPAELDEAARRQVERIRLEAIRAGNPDLDHDADWTDYAAAGATGPDDITERLVEVLRLVDLEDDSYQLGLRGTIDPNTQPELAARMLRVRAEFRNRMSDPALASLVEPFDRASYNKNLSVAENLLFGTPIGDTFRAGRIMENAYVRQILEDQDLMQPLAQVGRQIAETMVELFADLPAGHPFFEQYSFIDADDLPEFRNLLARVGKDGAAMDDADRSKLMAVSMPYIEARHRLGLIDEELEQRVLRARAAFAENLPPALIGAVDFYEPDRYIAAATLQDNILFGRLVYGQANAAERLLRVVTDVLGTLDLRRDVVEVGLDFPVGIGGKRLSAAQRQKLDLARALIKQPDLLLLNQSTALLDSVAQAKVMANILKSRAGRGVVWVLSHAEHARQFERVLVLKGGRVVAQGAASELDKPGSTLHQLAAAQ